MAITSIENKTITLSVKVFAAILFSTVSIVGSVLGAMYSINSTITRNGNAQAIINVQFDGKMQMLDLKTNTNTTGLQTLDNAVKQLSEKIK